MAPAAKPLAPSYSVDIVEMERSDLDRSENELSDSTDVEKAVPVVEKGCEKEQPQHQHQQHQQQQHQHQQQPQPSMPRGPPPNDLFQPKSVKFWMILLSNFLALFLVALDRTIVATAVPRITDDFHSLGDIGWYASAYMLTTAASQLLFGRIYKFYSMKWTFLLCVVVFEIGSAICGAAPSSPIFIAGRAVAGVASAGIFSGCMLIMVPMIPLHKRPMFQGLFGVVFGLASVIGPLVGGAFTSSRLTWRWCFYINLPVGAFTLAFMVLFWKPPPKPKGTAASASAARMSVWTQVKRLDPLGTALFLPGVVCVLLALEWGGAAYAWRSGRIVALFAAGGVLLAAFAAVQAAMPETATLPGRVVGQRSVLSGALFTFFLSASMLMLVYFVPVWFQTAKTVSPLRSGVYTMPLVLSLVVSSIGSGVLTQKLGYYVPSMLAGPVVMAVGEGLMSTFAPHTPAARWVAFQFLAGFGLGFGMQVGNLAAQTVLPPEDMSTGVAVMFFVQQLGGAVSTTVGQAVLNNLLVARLRAVPGLDELDADAIVKSGATELAAVVPAPFLPVVVAAYNYACTRIFLAAMGLAFAALVCALFMEWRSIKPPPGPPAAHAAPAPPAAPAAPPAPPLAGPSPGRVGAMAGIRLVGRPGRPSLLLAVPRTDAGRDAASVSASTATRLRSDVTQTTRTTQTTTDPSGSDYEKPPPLDPKIAKARHAADEKLREARRQSDPDYIKPQRVSARLSKTNRRSSGVHET